MKLHIPPVVRNGQQRSRGGFTLIEAIVVISTMTAVTVVGSTTIFFLMRSETRSAQRFMDDMTFSRVAARFRRDVHEAYEVQVSDDMAEIRLHHSGGRIVYQALDDKLLRSKVAGDETVSREPYRMPSASAEFELIDDGRLAVLLIRKQASPAGVSTDGLGRVFEFRIEAAVRRDHRFETRLSGLEDP